MLYVSLLGVQTFHNLDLSSYHFTQLLRWIFNCKLRWKEMYRTLPGVSTEFVLIGWVLRKRSVFILYFTHSHLFNENEHLTHTLRSKVRYFHVTPSTLETPCRELRDVSKVVPPGIELRPQGFYQ